MDVCLQTQPDQKVTLGLPQSSMPKRRSHTARGQLTTRTANMGRFVFNLLFLEGNQAFVLDASASVSRESSEYSGSSLDGDDADELNKSMQPHQAISAHNITSPKGRRAVDMFDEYEFVEPQHAQDVFIQKVASPPRGRNIADLFDESQQLDDARIQKSKRRLSECFDASEELDSC